MSRVWLLCVLLGGAVAAACSDGTGPAPAITVTSLSPANGPVAGGTVVTITGTNFPATIDSVLVAARRLGSLGWVSSTQLTGTTPAGSAAGAVDVTVYTTGAGSGRCTGCFGYLAVAPIILHYDGAGWGTALVENGARVSLASIWGTTASTIFAVGGSCRGPEILRYDGTGWSQPPAYRVGTNPQWLTSVWGSSASDVFAVGGGPRLHRVEPRFSITMVNSGTQCTGTRARSSALRALGRSGAARVPTLSP